MSAHELGLALVAFAFGVVAAVVWHALSSPWATLDYRDDVIDAARDLVIEAERSRLMGDVRAARAAALLVALREAVYALDNEEGEDA